jgi:uncharacterized protein (TIGR00725 family)
MSEVRRLPIVAILGSGDADHGNAELAEAVGRLVAEMECHLLTGGGLGVMRDACCGFASVSRRQGVSIGVIPRSLADDGPKEGYPNPWVEIPILTHLSGRLGPDGADSRNAINVLTAHRILALPGRSGTRAEIRLARHHGKPILAVLDAERLEEERDFLIFLKELRIAFRALRRDGTVWCLEEVRAFLL